MPGERGMTNDRATNDSARIPYDAILLVSFGGPEGPDDVLPFLENVLRGRNVPRERMLEVAVTTTCSAASARSTSRIAP